MKKYPVSEFDLYRLPLCRGWQLIVSRVTREIVGAIENRGDDWYATVWLDGRHGGNCCDTADSCFWGLKYYVPSADMEKSKRDVFKRVEEAFICADILAEK